MNAKYITDIALRIVIAIILAQTLFFKFSGAEESKWIFSTLMGENEALGRIGSGIVELIAVILLFVPGATVFGALIALGTITGAIFSHLTKLGIDVKGDGGLLFGLAIVVFVCSAAVLFLRRGEIPLVGKYLQVV